MEFYLLKAMEKKKVVEKQQGLIVALHFLMVSFHHVPAVRPLNVDTRSSCRPFSFEY